MSNIETMSNHNESTADMVLRTSKTEVYTRLLRARKNIMPIIGTGKGAYKDSTSNEWITIASKDDIKKAIYKPLSDEGLMLLFTQHHQQDISGMAKFKCKIVHAETGQFIEEYYQLPVTGDRDGRLKNTVWDWGSAQTYAFRYFCEAYLMIQIVDDLEQLEQDGVELWLYQSYCAYKTELEKCKNEEDIKKVNKNNEQFIKYTKEYGHKDYTKLVVKAIKTQRIKENMENLNEAN